MFALYLRICAYHTAYPWGVHHTPELPKGRTTLSSHVGCQHMFTLHPRFRASHRPSMAFTVPCRAFCPTEPSAVILLVGEQTRREPCHTEDQHTSVLKVFHYPFTVTFIQFAVGTVLVLLMWMFNLYKRPKVSAAQLVVILPLAFVHTLANVFTNVSLGKVAVSFTHTIKALEPFFSVLLSAIFLGERPTPWVVLSLLPIMGGVALASATEASFNWPGFASAMASNWTNQARNVLSKKLMVKKEETMDNITLFSIITIMSFILLTPVTIFKEGVKFTPAYMEAAGLNVQQVYMRSLLAALCFHAYQQVSYMILQRVSPVTHSVGNCVKRVVVIVSSVLFFQTPVSPINALGTGVALAGVFLYSRVKNIKAKPKVA